MQSTDQECDEIMVRRFDNEIDRAECQQLRTGTAALYIADVRMQILIRINGMYSSESIATKADKLLIVHTAKALR